MIYPKSANGKHTPAYRIWKAMMNRCYNSSESNPTYHGCFVVAEWHDFQNFAKFYHDDPWRQEGWQLDKDLLVRGNRMYSPETCVFVPQDLNLLFSPGKHKKIYPELPVGVCLHKASGKYLASLVKFGKNTYLGLFNTIDEARQSYTIARKSYIVDSANKWQNLINPSLYKALIDASQEI